MTKLNIANIDKVIEVIREEDKFFSMGRYWCYSSETRNYRAKSYETIQISDDRYSLVRSVCGTASCICGWANQIRLTENEDEFLKYELNSDVSAASWLGLCEWNSQELFHATHSVINLNDITRNHAIAVLENLKETDQVNWNMAPFVE